MLLYSLCLKHLRPEVMLLEKLTGGSNLYFDLTLFDYTWAKVDFKIPFLLKYLFGEGICTSFLFYKISRIQIKVWFL